MINSNIYSVYNLSVKIIEWEKVELSWYFQSINHFFNLKISHYLLSIHWKIIIYQTYWLRIIPQQNLKF
jgi:hypothetical protein